MNGQNVITNETNQNNVSVFHTSLGVGIPFCLAGFVNDGGSFFILALPFYYLLFETFRLTKNIIIKVLLVVFFIIGFSLFVLRSDDSKLYRPLVGQTIVAAESLCLIQQKKESGELVSFFLKKRKADSCNNPSLYLGEINIRYIEISKGSQFTVEKIFVERNWFFPEHYSPIVKTPFGLVKIFYTQLDNVTPLMRKFDNSLLKDEDFINSFFYIIASLINLIFIIPFSFIAFRFLIPQMRELVVCKIKNE